jgi:hypothetical protein
MLGNQYYKSNVIYLSSKLTRPLRRPCFEKTTQAVLELLSRTGIERVDGSQRENPHCIGVERIVGRFSLAFYRKLVHDRLLHEAVACVVRDEAVVLPLE